MTEPTDPDRAFALFHVPALARTAISTLWRLDEQLGQIVASTSDPMVGQMRLLWWREALISAVSGHPLLDEVTSCLAPQLAREELAMLVDGWEELLEPLPFDDVILCRYAIGRGARLFTFSGALLGDVIDVRAGEGWALADFARRCSDPATADRAFKLAELRLETAAIRMLSRPLRILARLAQNDAKARGRAPRTAWTMIRALA